MIRLDPDSINTTIPIRCQLILFTLWTWLRPIGSRISLILIRLTHTQDHHTPTRCWCQHPFGHRALIRARLQLKTDSILILGRCQLQSAPHRRFDILVFINQLRMNSILIRGAMSTNLFGWQSDQNVIRLKVWWFFFEQNSNSYPVPYYDGVRHQFLTSNIVYTDSGVDVNGKIMKKWKRISWHGRWFGIDCLYRETKRNTRCTSTWTAKKSRSAPAPASNTALRCTDESRGSTVGWSKSMSGMATRVSITACPRHPANAGRRGDLAGPTGPPFHFV